MTSVGSFEIGTAFTSDGKLQKSYTQNILVYSFERTSIKPESTPYNVQDQKRATALE